MRVALVRHPAVAIAAGVCYGRSDVALSSEGTAQLPRVAEALAGFPPGPVWTSPARRCRATAGAIAEARPVQSDARLLELDFGAWEGRPWDDIPRGDLDRWAADPWHFVPPGGESAALLAARVDAFHAMLLAEGRDCVVVSHGGPLKCLSALLAGQPIDILGPPLALAEVRVINRP